MVLSSPTGVALKSLNMSLGPEEILKLRNSSVINCSTENKPIECKPLEETCLFNINQDPCELRNLAKEYYALGIYLARNN